MQDGDQALPLIPVILAGGSGTRLWPMSRHLYPKQFIPLLDDQSLFQATLQRLEGLDGVQAPIVVCNDEHRFLAAEQLRQLGVDNARIMLEPTARNTAPAIAVAALEALAHRQDALLLVLPADHLIEDVSAFHHSVLTGIAAALKGRLITFGVVPTRAETGYGYIRQGPPLKGAQASVLEVDAFVEKPDEAKAQRYIAEGGYLWNSGMFMFRASKIVEQLQEHASAIHAASQAAFEARTRDLDFIRIDAAAFEKSPSESIDYAVMERTSEAAVVPMEAGWSDVGSWQALWAAESKSDGGNVENGDVISEDCNGCYIHASHRLIGAVGLEDMVVVETADAVLVAPRDRSQEVRRVVDKLKSSERHEALLHRKVYRPWGAYEGIDAAERFQVKRITVEPGHSLSLQMHHHRAEHWVVVKGTARITCDDKEFMLSENESTYIPLGVKHRLDNPGKIPLEIIEVQSGSYLGEDDIVRFDDKYGR